MRKDFLKVTHLGINSGRTKTATSATSQVLFALFLGYLTVATSSRKPSCTWGKQLLSIPKKHLWFYPLSYLFPLTTLILWTDTLPRVSSLLDIGDGQIPLPSFTLFLNHRSHSQVCITTPQPTCPPDISISVHGIFSTPVGQAHNSRILFNFLFYP